MQSSVIMVCGLMVLGCTIRPSDTMKRGPPHHMDMTPEEIEDHHKCMEEIGYTPLPPEHAGPPIREDMHKFHQCMAACYMQIKGVLKDNKIDPGAAAAAIDDMPLGEMFDKERIPNCSEQANKLEDKCDVNWSFHKCMMEGIENMFPEHMRPDRPDGQ